MTSFLWSPKVLEPDFYSLKGYQLAWLNGLDWRREGVITFWRIVIDTFLKYELEHRVQNSFAGSFDSDLGE